MKNKIGIYTIHAAQNYGAMLQAFGTEKFLNKNHFNAEIVNLFPKEIERKNSFIPSKLSLRQFARYLYTLSSPKIWRLKKSFKKFHNGLKLSDRYESIEQIYTNPPQYDIHLVGSDQVWNIENGIPKKPYFYLDFIEGANKISYASSIASDEIPEAYQSRIKELLNSFSYIGVREDIGASNLTKITGRKVQQVIDPTFLLTQEEWYAMIPQDPIINEDYVMYYGFDSDKKTQDILDLIKKRTGLKTVVVTPNLFTPFKCDYCVKSAGPLEFLNLIKHAKLIATSSFHGVAFSINFKKPFIAMRYKKRSSRVESLLRIVGLESQLVDDVEMLDRQFDKISTINFKTPDKLLAEHIETSKQWLIESLQNLQKGAI